MAVTDKKMDSKGWASVKKVSEALVCAVSKTNRVFAVIRPGHGFIALAIRLYATVVAGTVTVTAFIMDQLYGFISAPTLAIDATAEKWKCGAFVARVAGVFIESAAVTAKTFTLAHVITKNTFGCVLIQMSNAGVFSTKVAAATQAYASAELALDALPAPDAGKIAVGYIAIAALVGTDWTANTDDMTDASDVTTATFVSSAAATALVTGALAPVAGEVVEGVLQGSAPDRRGTSADDIVLVYTADGTGALTNGSVSVDYRPAPLNNEF